MFIFKNLLRQGANFLTFRHFSKLLLLILILIICSSKPALAQELTNDQQIAPDLNWMRQLDVASGLETNRTLGDRITLHGIYTGIYQDHYYLQSGISLNTQTGYVNAIFIDLGHKLDDPDFQLHIKFLGNQYREYSRAANSILPYLSWDSGVYFIETGLNFRFLNVNREQLYNIFYYKTPVSETVFYYRLGKRFVFPDKRYSAVLEVNNGDAMYLGNIGSYGFFLNNRLAINERVTFYGNVGFRQSGSIALAATNYKTYLFFGVDTKL